MTDRVSLATRFLNSSASGMSSEHSLRSFLERKGLTTSEINEALSVTRKGGGGGGGGGGLGGAGPGWSWIISWIALPLAVLGTGVLVLKLTGGEEEFPKPPEQEHEQERQNQHFQLQPSSHTLPAGDFGPSSSSGGGDVGDEWTMVREEHTEEPPEWAKELQRMTLALSEDIQFIKAKLLEMEIAGKSNEVSLDPDNPPADAPKPPSVETRLSLVREAFRHMIDASAGSDEALKKCSGALGMYIKMLVDNPDTPRYRRISVANDSFKSLVQPVIGADKVLESVGFALRGLYYEWTWISDSVDEAVRTRVLTVCLKLLERAKQDGCSTVVDDDEPNTLSAAEEAPSVSHPADTEAENESAAKELRGTPPRREASTLPSMVEITRAAKASQEALSLSAGESLGKDSSLLT